jgi:hypothetical protein
LTWKREDRLGDGDAAGEAATGGDAVGTDDDGDAVVDVDFAQPDSAMRTIAMIVAGVRGTG